MPYIEGEQRRSELRSGSPALDCGELNYQISQLIDNYLIHHDLSYAKLNDVAGVLSLLDFEVKRRIVALYEEDKKQRNGDVFHVIRVR